MPMQEAGAWGDELGMVTDKVRCAMAGNVSPRRSTAKYTRSSSGRAIRPGRTIRFVAAGG